ncbi:unnamed protein product, partial [Mesorhabditis belari]|uniref:NHR domain-containing protein n=1 Tax=Mesorhabditis belari TaxID=2138241 RepID=A0AAF3F4B1_9BILA
MATAVGRSTPHPFPPSNHQQSRAIRGPISNLATTFSSPNVSTKGSIRFHAFHGENIVLFEDRRRALRSASFEKALVFTERALRVGEPFCVSIEGVEGGWTGHLRVGLTTANPADRPDSSILSETSWMISISPFSSLDSPSTSLPTDIGSRIGVYYLPSENDPAYARLYIVWNGHSVPSDIDRIPMDRPLYGVVDVFGNTKEVRAATEMNGPPRLAELCSRTVRMLVSKGICSMAKLPPSLQQELFQ